MSSRGFIRSVSADVRSIKQIRQQIDRYEKTKLDLVSKWSNSIPEWVRKEINALDNKISELKWTIYDDWEAGS